MLTNVQHEATVTAIVFIVAKLPKYVSALCVVLAKLLREKNTSLSLPQKENARMSPQDQDHSLLALSCCCRTKDKSCFIRNLKAEKTEDMERRAPSSSFAHSELFREKPWAQCVLLLMLQ